MRARHSDAARPADKVRVNIGFAQRHIRAILAVEDQGELLLIANSQQNQSCQPFRIGDNAAGLDPFSGERLADKPAHMFITHPCDECRFQTEPGCSDCHVGW